MSSPFRVAYGLPVTPPLMALRERRFPWYISDVLFLGSGYNNWLLIFNRDEL